MKMNSPDTFLIFRNLSTFITLSNIAYMSALSGSDHFLQQQPADAGWVAGFLNPENRTEFHLTTDTVSYQLRGSKALKL